MCSVVKGISTMNGNWSLEYPQRKKYRVARFLIESCSSESRKASMIWKARIRSVRVLCPTGSPGNSRSDACGCWCPSRSNHR